MVVINRMPKDSCENSHVCYYSLLDSHGVFIAGLLQLT